MTYYVKNKHQLEDIKRLSGSDIIAQQVRLHQKTAKKDFRIDAKEIF